MAQNGKSGRNLINKLFRRERYIKTNVRPDKGAAMDKYDKIFQGEETIDRENKIERLMRKVARRLDRAFSMSPEAHKPAMSTRQKVAVARVVYAPAASGHAIQLTFAQPELDYEGYAVGDVVVFLNGQLKGQNLLIVSIPDSTHILLEDVATATSASNITVRINLNGSKRSYR